AVARHRPWPRAVMDAALWEEAARLLGRGELSLAGLWAEPDVVHLALLEEGAPATLAVLSLSCREGHFPSVGAHHAPAIRLERTIRDLFGLEPQGLPDKRPWLDHGRWPRRRPLSPGAAGAAAESPQPYAFLPVEGEGLTQIPVGPVHAGIIEPGHFRFTTNGETVVRLEERLGYVHRGLEGLLSGIVPLQAARLAGRASGDSTVAYAYAFARALEAALEIEAPPRAQWLRALLAELERLANHLGDIGAICNDASFALIQTHCAILRERVLRTAESCFGHRLMRDRIVPGGVAADLDGAGAAAMRDLLREVRHVFPVLVKLYDNTASLLDRTVATGILSPALARRFGAGGFVGRASGRPFDARRWPGYPPYDRLTFEVPTLQNGDVNARVWIRIREVEQSLSLIEQILEGLPAGPVARDVPETPAAAAEGMAMVEAFRGDLLVWLRIDADGQIARCHLRDASWFQWPLLEAVIEGNIVADFPLCNKSFNCSYAGHDL
ncbi:MAG TPA: hydrogenase expression protein HypE, partial [Kiloniellales bacterium]|nr:hydrogenase expression protein HypE [Kiloniellales bacterium]